LLGPSFGVAEAGYRLLQGEGVRMRLIRALFAVCTLALLAAAPPAATLSVKLIAINDFHGYLEPSESFVLPDPADPAKSVRVPVGGAAYLAAAVAHLRSENPRNVMVGAGDMVGASPLGSAVFHDEPTIQALNAMGLEFTSVGNHEFDEGKVELLRKQHGGCRPGGNIGVDTCLIDRTFSGAKYKYLAANVIDDATGKTLFPPYAIKYFDAGNGKRVGIAFIGVILKDTPVVTTAAGVRGLHFNDEATTINALLPSIYAQGVHAVVVLIHQGIFTKVGYNDPSCAGADGDLLPVLNKLDRSIRLVVSGHTHRAYLCASGQGSDNPHVFYTAAGKYGQIVSDITVDIDIKTGTIANIAARNELVVNDHAANPIARTDPALVPNPAIAALVARYDGATAPLVNRVIGHITADISLDGGEVARGGSGESAIGDIIADARVAAANVPPPTPSIGIINGGGIRSSLSFNSTAVPKAAGDVTFGETYNVQPFSDLLYTETLTGQQVITLLDEQWIGKKEVELLGISRNLAYTWDASKPDGVSKLVPDSVKFDGKPLDLTASYRVTVDAFMVDGGDGYVVLRQGTQKTAGPMDLSALDAYITAHSPLAPPQSNRIIRLH
jgi:5'-nucleotidase